MGNLLIALILSNSWIAGPYYWAKNDVVPSRDIRPSTFDEDRLYCEKKAEETVMLGPAARNVFVEVIDEKKFSICMNVKGYGLFFKDSDVYCGESAKECNKMVRECQDYIPDTYFCRVAKEVTKDEY